MSDQVTYSKTQIDAKDAATLADAQTAVSDHEALTGTNVHGLGTMATQSSGGVNITGGTIGGSATVNTTGSIQGATISCIKSSSQSSGSSTTIGTSVGYLQSGGTTSNYGFLVQATGTRGSGSIQSFFRADENGVNVFNVDKDGNVYALGSLSVTTGTITKNAIGTTSTDGLIVTSTTTGSVQYSPRIRLHGNGRNTASGTVDYPLDVILEVRGASNNYTTTSSNAFAMSISANGGAYTDFLLVTHGGGSVSSSAAWSFGSLSSGTATISRSMTNVSAQGLSVSASSTSTSGVQNVWSPFISLGGNVWDGSASRTTAFRAEMKTNNSGGASHSGELVFSASIANTDLGAGSGNPAEMFAIDARTKVLRTTGDRLRLPTSKTPSSASDTGTQGDICWDSSYVYVCVATNTWKRTAISTW